MEEPVASGLEVTDEKLLEIFYRAVHRRCDDVVGPARTDCSFPGCGCDITEEDAVYAMRDLLQATNGSGSP